MSKMLVHSDDSEVNFLLELNLQSIRRELVLLLEESQRRECFTCNRLKCCCPPPPAPLATSTTPATPESCLSTLSSGTPDSCNEKTKDDRVNKSYEEIEQWIKSCSVSVEVKPEKGKEVANITWPPAVSSIWNDKKLDTSKLLNLKPAARCNNVEAFFKKFGDIQLTPDIITGALSLISLHGGQKEQVNKYATAMLRKMTNMSSKVSADYSYF